MGDVKDTARQDAEQTLDGTLPYEETWSVNAEAVLALLSLLERTEEERDARAHEYAERERDRLLKHALEVQEERDRYREALEAPEIQGAERLARFWLYDYPDAEIIPSREARAIAKALVRVCTAVAAGSVETDR